MVQSTYLDERDLKALSVHYAGNKQVDLKQSENYKDTPNPIQHDMEINFSGFSEYQQNVTICQFSFMASAYNSIAGKVSNFILIY